MSDQAEIRKIMAKTAKVLIARQSIIQFFSLFSSVLLARLLTPQDFGLYAIIGLFLQFLTLISDGGIGSGLIQREKEPDRETYSVAFTVIQILYLGICLIAIPGAILFAHLYRAMSLNIWMIYTFILEFYLSSFRVIPVAKLERRFDYTRLAVVEISEYFSFQSVAVVLALMEKGVWSFIFGALVSRTVGIVLVHILSPFTPRVRFDLNIARPLLRFGIALQLSDIFVFIQNSFSPSFVAFKLGTAAVGFSNFARKVGSYPTYPLSVLNRMTFPILSRVQDNEDQFQGTLNDIIRIYNIVLYGTTAALVGVVPETIHIIYGDKWMAATNLIYSVIVGMLVTAYTGPISAAIMAKGRGKLFLVTNSLNALVNWSIAVPSVLLFGYNGLIALNITALITFPITLLIIQRYIRVRIWSNLWRPAGALVVTYAAQRILVYVIRPHTLLSLVACLFLGALLYSIIILAVDDKTRNWLVNHGVASLRGWWSGQRGGQEV